MIKLLLQNIMHMGIDFRQVLAIKNIFKFFRQRKAWKKLGGKIDATLAILHDYNDSAGQHSGHYFHQDLLVASEIYKMNPKRHIDVGSRVDGFVAHVASFRKIEVFDIRDMEPTKHENIKFVKADLMKSQVSETADSVSCLHALEHFGLGRYGDPIDPDGFTKGLNAISKLVEIGGRLYVSFPLASQNLVYFNAHRTMHPTTILNIECVKNKFNLERFDYIDDYGDLHLNIEPEGIDPIPEYACGIYTFVRVAL